MSAKLLIFAPEKRYLRRQMKKNVAILKKIPNPIYFW